jgi:hypothetical protein
MTDKELLKYAAKAIGYVEPHSYRPNTNSLMWVGESGASVWRPFDDDASAFELMVNLDISVYHGWTYADEKVPYANVCAQHIPSKLEVGEIKGDDPKAATRRVIIRAAAELGKAMEKNGD